MAATLHEVHLRSEFNWFLAAENHKETASLLLDSIPPAGRGQDAATARLTAGMVRVSVNPERRDHFLYHALLAIENLVKGIWVKRHPEIPAGDIFSPSHIGHHNLRRLFRAARVWASSAEWAFLHLAPLVNAVARFPVPIDAMSPMTIHDDLDLDQVNPTFLGLYGRLRDQLLEDFPGDP
jgi:hypothetical protein